MALPHPDRDRAARRGPGVALRAGHGHAPALGLLVTTCIALGAPAPGNCAPSAPRPSLSRPQEAELGRVQRAFDEVWELVQQGALPDAVVVLDEALVEVQKPYPRALLLVRRAEMLRGLGQHSAAVEGLDTAVALLGSSTNERALACFAHGVRAQAYLGWGLFDVAETSIRRMRAELAQLEAKGRRFDNERLQADFVEASVLLASGRYEELELAVGGYLESELYARSPFDRARLQWLRGMGLMEVARLEPELAQRSIEQLEAALAEPSLPSSSRLHPELALAELALRRHDWETARAHLARTAALLEDVDSTEINTRSRLMALEARLLLERDDREKPPFELEAMRARLEAGLRERLAEWRLRDLRSGGQGLMQYTDSQMLMSELIRLDLEIDGPDLGALRAFQALLETEGAGTLARRLGAGPATLEQVRVELLGADGQDAILVWFPAPDRSHLFVLERERLDHIELVQMDLLERAVREVERTLQGPQPSDAPDWSRAQRRDALERARALVLPDPVRARLETWRKLTLVGRDLLFGLPFEALPLGPEGKGSYLGLEFAIADLPSLGAGLALKRRPLPTSGAVVLAAAPDPGAPLGDRAEFEALLSPYGPEGHLLLGAGLDLERLRRELAGARTAQLFTHGRLDPTRERPAVIELSPIDGQACFLGADEIETLDAPPLVILTVCNAGRAPLRRGDAGAADLAGAFFLGGGRSRCVMLSSYPLDVEAGRRLSIALHAALADGAPPAEALRRARCALAAEEGFADPFYHGLMRLVGPGQ